MRLTFIQMHKVPWMFGGQNIILHSGDIISNRSFRYCTGQYLWFYEFYVDLVKWIQGTNLFVNQQFAIKVSCREGMAC